MTTSKVPRCDEHISERRNHGHNPIDHLNPSLGRRATGLALQFWLGLLAEWRTRIDSFDFNNSRVNRTPVNGGAFGLTRRCSESGRRSLGTSSALEQVNDQDYNGNYEQEMN